jgi:hypothetical protein
MRQHFVASASLALAILLGGSGLFPAQPPIRLRAFTGCTLIDGTGRAPVPNATLLVRNGRIVVAPSAW